MFESLTGMIARRWARHCTVCRLQMLDDQLLADLGIGRRDISRFVAGTETI